MHSSVDDVRAPRGKYTPPRARAAARGPAGSVAGGQAARRSADRSARRPGALRATAGRGRRRAAPAARQAASPPAGRVRHADGASRHAVRYAHSQRYGSQRSTQRTGQRGLRNPQDSRPGCPRGMLGCQPLLGSRGSTPCTPGRAHPSRAEPGGKRDTHHGTRRQLPAHRLPCARGPRQARGAGRPRVAGCGGWRRCLAWAARDRAPKPVTRGGCRAGWLSRVLPAGRVGWAARRRWRSRGSRRGGGGPPGLVARPSWLGGRRWPPARRSCLAAWLRAGLRCLGRGLRLPHRSFHRGGLGGGVRRGPRLGGEAPLHLARAPPGSRG